MGTQVDARKSRLDEREALALARGATRVVVAKGRNVVTFESGERGYDEEALLAAIIGPTGNLRAPAILRSKTLYVGFHAETYERALG